MISDRSLSRALPKSWVVLLGDLIRWLLWALVLSVWVAFLPIYFRMIGYTLRDPSHSDFTIFYYSARLIADGFPMYGASPSRYGVSWAADNLGNLNPPHFQLLAFPLSYLTYGQALAAWVLVGLVCLSASIALIVRELQISWSWPRFWLWGAFTLSSAAFTTVAVTCEMTFMLMLPFTLAWRAWRAERWTTAAAWLGACASLKLFLLLFLPWLLWRRQWRAAGAFAAAVSCLVLLGMAAFGVESYRQWIATLGQVFWWWMQINASWHGFVSRVLEGGVGLAPLIHRQELVRPVAVLGSGVLALATVVVAARSARMSKDRQMLFLFVGALLSSPLGWLYYLPLAYGPMLGWLGAGRGWERLRQFGATSVTLLIVGLALTYVPHESTLAGQPSGLASLTIGSTYFWAVLLLWLSAGTARTT